eukprot:TRINITY_DN13511_c0_g1_i1.p1 TRINITY_DN13511_c0_g1~~TRINITY_DN13511_c0_g1_i1.p1  ORF type:complete len:272 (-),score=52.09 TRINITY_DN13511_c0_g1_i1:2-715(-)
MAAQWTEARSECLSRLAEGWLNAVWKPVQRFLKSEVSDATLALDDLEKRANQTSITPRTTRIKSFDMKTYTGKIDPDLKAQGNKTLALMVDTVDRMELVLMEQTISYMKMYNQFLDESVREINSHMTELAQYQQLYERKFSSYERGDNTAFLTASEKFTKMFGVSIEDLLSREGGEVPIFLSSSISFLRSIDSKSVEGIFRISGVKTEMDDMVNKINMCMFFFWEFQRRIKITRAKE